MLKVKVDYPTQDEEMSMLALMTSNTLPEKIASVVKPKQIMDARSIVRSIYVDDKIHKYVTDIVFATRYPDKYGIESISGLIDVGASPRASLNLVRAAKAHAFLQHRGYVTPEDIREIGMDVLRHRVLLSFEAEAEDVTVEDVIQSVFDTIPVP
jgi:MoxR-like ATPase